MKNQWGWNGDGKFRTNIDWEIKDPIIQIGYHIRYDIKKRFLLFSLFFFLFFCYFLSIACCYSIFDKSNKYSAENFLINDIWLVFVICACICMCVIRCWKFPIVNQEWTKCKQLPPNKNHHHRVTLKFVKCIKRGRKNKQKQNDRRKRSSTEIVWRVLCKELLLL